MKSSDWLNFNSFEPMTVTAQLSDRSRVELELSGMRALLGRLLEEKFEVEQMIEYVTHKIRERLAEEEEYAKQKYDIDEERGRSNEVAG